MKDLPPLAGWPMQTSFVREPKSPFKKKRGSSRHSRKKLSKRK